MAKQVTVTPDNAVDVALGYAALMLRHVPDYYRRDRHRLRKALVLAGYLKKVQKNGVVEYLTPDHIEFRKRCEQWERERRAAK